jgi:hypothetical protein
MRCILAVLLWLSINSLCMGETVPIDPEKQHVIIAFMSEKFPKMTESRGQIWKKLCDRMGNILLHKPDQAGVFSSFACRGAVKLPKTAESSSWLLDIFEKEKQIDIEISYQYKDQKYLVQNFKFEFKGDFLEDLRNNKAINNLVHLIIESLPTGSYFQYRGLNKSLTIPIDDTLSEAVPSLMVFSLAFNLEKKIWVPELRARLNFSQLDTDANGKKTASYTLATEWWPLIKGQSYWVQNTQGRNQRQEVYQKGIAANLPKFFIVDMVDSLIFDSLSSNIVGLRYGQPMVHGASVISRLSMISLLVELRSGPLSGLRWYYDYTPLVKNNIEGGVDHFGMKRSSIGWAFNFEAPKPIQTFVSNFDLQPKFGLFDIDYESVAYDEHNTPQIIDFRAKNLLSLSLELGLEKQIMWVRSRLWASYSSSQLGFTNLDKVSVLSTKVGFDNYLDIFKFKRLKVGSLIFGQFEKTSLLRELQLGAETGPGISNMSFDLFYVGGGLILSW